MDLPQLLALNLVVVAALMAVVWLISLPLQNVSIVDIFWGLGFVVIAWISAAGAGFASPRSWWLPVLVSIWGLRLAGYLTWRNHGQPEDHRYQEMRQRHGSRFWWVSLFVVFGLQGVIMWVVSLPLQIAPRSAAGLNAWDGIGIVLWVAGMIFETVGDLQLARFKSNPANRGRVLDRGLWRYTRHPNYFGDFLVWWAFYAISVAGGQGWWTVISPLVMSVLLMRISGVTLLERTLKERRGGYSDYMQRTSAFFPWPPTRRQ